MVHRGVAVHDDLAMIDRRVQELVANPEQIFGALLCDRDTRTYSRVDEQKISTSETIAQALEK